MAQTTPSNPKATWLMIVVAFIVMKALLVFVAFNGGSSSADSERGVLAMLAYVGAPICWIATVLLAQAKMRADLEPAPFQSATVIALAVNEMATLLAFVAFMNSTPERMLIIAGISILVDIVVILPKGLNYWAERAR